MLLVWIDTMMTPDFRPQYLCVAGQKSVKNRRSPFTLFRSAFLDATRPSTLLLSLPSLICERDRGRKKKNLAPCPARIDSMQKLCYARKRAAVILYEEMITSRISRILVTCLPISHI